MKQQTPLFLLKTRDILLIILTGIGIGLLLVYGSRAIATADDKRYVEGWKNRPFLIARPVNPVSAPDQVVSPASVEKKPVVDAQVAGQATDKAEHSTDKQSTARAQQNAKEQPSAARPTDRAQTNENNRSSANEPSNSSGINTTVNKLLKGLGF